MFAEFRKLIFDAVRGDRAACSQCKHNDGDGMPCNLVEVPGLEPEYGKCPVVERTIVNAYNFGQNFPEHRDPVTSGANPTHAPINKREFPPGAVKAASDGYKDELRRVNTLPPAERSVLLHPFADEGNPATVPVKNLFLVGLHGDSIRILKLDELLTTAHAANLAAYIVSVAGIPLEEFGDLVNVIEGREP